MPLLAKYANTLKNSLQGMRILYINHAICDSLLTACALRDAGANVTTVVIPYGPMDSSERGETLAGFRSLGETFVPNIPHPTHFNASMRGAVIDALRHMERALGTFETFMIVEDGGYAFPILHEAGFEALLEKCIGAVEHTSRGMWNYQFMETDGVPRTPRTLAKPAITIARSSLKTTHEPAFVAQAVVEEFWNILKREHLFAKYKDVTVIGCGRIGKAIAHMLQINGSRVRAVDPDDAQRRAMNELNGACETAASITDEALERTDIFLGASGMPSFGTQHLEKLLASTGPERRVVLCSASSKNAEFGTSIERLHAMALEDRGVTETRVRGYGLRYACERASGRALTIDVVADGYPCIFFPSHTNGGPNGPFDPIMTELFIAAAALRANHDLMENRLHMLSEMANAEFAEGPWKDASLETSLINDWCAASGIDASSYRASIGL